jgi:ketosteroid isomerase-like protein
MSQENVGRGVRYPISMPSGRAGQRRSFDERLLVRFPALYRPFAARWTRLPPGSRLRRLLLRRTVARGAAAFNRRDFELALLGLDPEIEWVEDPRRADGRIYRGHEGVRESFERWLENFEEYEFEVEWMVDCGDKILVYGREEGRGSLSGGTISQRIYTVHTFRDGKVARYEEFYDEQDAFEAAGLRE